MTNPQQQILIATLSSEPQGVTRVLDWLLAQGYPIGEVIVVHTVGAVIQPALAAVASEFAAGFYGDIRYRHLAVMGATGPVTDIRSAADAEALLQTLYRVMRRARQLNQPIHLSITSGRKTMAVYGMVAAQLLFTEQDHVWHMMAIDESGVIDKRLHAESDEMMEMVEVPVLRWADAATARTLLEEEDLWSALQRQQTLTHGEKARRVKEFLDRYLTKRERELVLLLARTGLDNAGLARLLNKREQTVANQLTAVYKKFEEWQGLGSGSSGTRAGLVAVLRPYVGEG
jgi:CRISPR-associated protein Csx14